MEVGATGRYQVIEVLGQGGMAAVFLADDTLRARRVALKRLLIDGETKHREERIALFHREYRTLAELRHPRVIQVFDFGTDEQGPYYTMEVLDGSDLSSRAPLPWREACLLARDVCSSLALLHSRGYVHRDVSALNVRCTEDGRAKLIDFGAMVPMGISTLAMGTPPCVAPEALERQPLDGRTDLFALGATLYFTLTGRHAFPARQMTQLRALHERAPRPPSSYAADVPPALDRLLLSLLSIDPMARPRHAAEVMERLTILAELAPIEQVAVHQSYLNTPALVGRDPACRALAESLRTALAGRGVVLRMHAAEGGGRSRMLHAGMMDARLAGMLVLHAGSSIAGSAPYGVLRALLGELRAGGELAPAPLAERAALRRLLEDDAAPLDDAGARELILNELSGLFLELARAHSILIAIDDINRCDEPSLAALLTLSALVNRAALELVYTDTNASLGDKERALGLLREMSSEIALPPLDESQTEALLGSVFGQVPNLATVARFVFERAAGNPRATMELAQALVGRGYARYELGSWSLPSRLAADALPASFSDVRRAKFEALGADARELAEILAIVDGYVVQPEDLSALTEHRDAARLAEAHAELLDVRVVEPGDAQVLADRSWLEIVREAVDPVRSRLVHRRLSEVLELRNAHPTFIARCLLRAGEETRALDVLCAALARGSLVDAADSDYPELLQEAERACVRLERRARDRFLVQRELVTLADRVIVKGLAGHFQCVFARLSIDSGLDDWQKLEGQLPEEPRFVQALTQAQARFDATPEVQRVMAPLDAVKCLVETTYAAAVYGAMIGDIDLIDSLPSLRMFEPLSPAIAGVNAALRGQRALIGALYEDALELYTTRLEALNSGALVGLTEDQIQRSRLLLHYALGSLQGGLGIKGALEHAKLLEGMPHGQIMAAAVQENYHVRRGNTRAAEHWRRRRELLQIQQKRPHALKLRQTTQQIECSTHAEDLEETKRNVEVLEELVEIYPSARPYLYFGRGEYERLRGDYAAGLRHVRLCLDAIEPGRHPVWPWAAGCEIECLRQLDQLAIAREVGEQRVRAASEAGMRVMRDHVETFLALVEAQLGLFDKATERLDRGIAYREFFGMYGLNLGWSYEARARVSLWMKDRVSFEHCLRRCSEHYQNGRDNPALAARYGQLLQAARATWGEMDDLALEVAENLSTVPDGSEVMTQLPSFAKRLSACKDRQERASFVLQQLLAAANCQDGQLYLLREGGVSLAAGATPSQAMRALVERLLGLGAEADEARTVSGEDDSTGETTAARLYDFKPMLLTCMRGDVVTTVGVLALRSEGLAVNRRFAATARDLCNALIDFGDVQPTSARSSR